MTRMLLFISVMHIQIGVVVVVAVPLARISDNCKVIHGV